MIQNIATIASADLRIPFLMSLLIPADFIHAGQKLLESRNFEWVSTVAAKYRGNRRIFNVDGDPMSEKAIRGA